MRQSEIQFLKTLWRWKVLSYPLAHKLSFSSIVPSNFYSKARRLIREGYIVESVGDGITFQVLHLTKKGFQFIKNDIGELRESRFNPQSISHDYLATAFQLGCSQCIDSSLVTHVTEQQIQSLESDLLPEWVPQRRDHIPDGLFQIEIGGVHSRYAIEVDINLKPLLRYDKTAYYFDNLDSKIDVVFWLCGNINIAESIYRRIQKANLNRFDIHHFILTDDFKAHGWNSQARSGQYAGKSIQQIYAMKSSGNPSGNLGKPYCKNDSEILFPTLKTPWRKRT